jgi:hypothetical protein
MNDWRWSKVLLPDIRLPGVYVEPLAAGARDDLPPMDIALFAGFAARGPCNIAMAVDSVAAFEACFGDDVSLARSSDVGAPLAACLPASVRAFFANGGRRCWVVRLARTAAHEARWNRYTNRPIFAADTAATNEYVLSGMLRCQRGSVAGTSVLRAASLEASSVGSWSDAMQASVRCLQTPFVAKNLSAIPFGVAFDDTGDLRTGALIEFCETGETVRHFAKTMRSDTGRMLALSCMSIEQLSGPAGPLVTGIAQIAGYDQIFNATLDGGAEPYITLESETRELQEGKWLIFTDMLGATLWMQVDRIDRAKAYGTAWRKRPFALPTGDFSARSFTVDIAARLGGTEHIAAGLNPGLSGAQSIHALVSDDEACAAHDRRCARSSFPLCATASERKKASVAAAAIGEASFEAMAAAFGTLAFTTAHHAALCHAWLPVGTGPAFDKVASANAVERDALQRDGLSRFDDSLFLDPAFASASANQIEPLIEQVRDMQEEALSGIHAGLDTPEHGFGSASIFAVPDLSQPGWQLAADSGLAGPPQPGAPDQADWYDHGGGCSAKKPVVDAAERDAPDSSRFLDCATRLVATPALTGPATAGRDGRFLLQWSGGPPDAIFVLEEAVSADFRSAVEIYRGTATERLITQLKDGSYYYRLHAQADENVSAYSAIGVVVQASRYVAIPADTGLLQRLHVAMMRIAGGTADMFALLSMPNGFDAKAAIKYSSELRTVSNGFGGAQKLGHNEERALSYAALYYPWIWYRTNRSDRGSTSTLALSAPEGFLAGQMAASAISRGAWIAPANDLIDDMVDLNPVLPESAHLMLYNSRINLLRRDPRGFVLLDADTLSAEPEWRQINVRRLMILLRRLALQRGQTYVFEPNGDVMRRAVERDLTFALDGMQRRGAFAGKTSAQSFRIAADIGANDIEQGRMIFEVGVAPSQPMRFLNIRLVQRGARLTVAEEAA